MLLQRIVTVLIGGPLVIAAIFCPWIWVFKIFVLGCLGVALWEFFTIVGFEARGRYFSVALGLLHSVYMLFTQETRMTFEVSLLLIAVFFYYCLWERNRLEGIAQRLALTFLGVFYVGTLGSLVGLVRQFPHGVFWVFVLLGVTWLNDTFAYFFGHRFGRRKLAPQISPGKTVEGFLGGLLGSLFGFWIFWILFQNPLTFGQGAVMALLAGIVGPVGDLSESLIKRSFDVKDSGNIIRGHGGMLDRIDALLFTAPVVYWYASLFSEIR